jgi:hypothetical protein
MIAPLAENAARIKKPLADPSTGGSDVVRLGWQTCDPFGASGADIRSFESLLTTVLI